MKPSVALLLGLMLSVSLAASGWASETAKPRVRLTTSLGAIVLELEPQAAPRTVDNFLTYVRDGFYDGTVFHRVIKGFMIQGGGLDVDMQRKTPRGPIRNEADNGLKNRRGTIAMARTTNPHSATAQFFINTVNNDFLDHRGMTVRGWGYCVFGRVVAGMPVVRAIEQVPTTARQGASDVPVTAVIIERAVIEQVAVTGPDLDQGKKTE